MKLITENSSHLILLIITLTIQLTIANKVVVKYFGEDFLVDGGCKARDETVLK